VTTSPVQSEASDQLSLQHAICERKAEPSWRVAVCFFLLLIGLHLTAGPILDLPNWHVDPSGNPPFQEAMAWRNGRMDLPQRARDTALFNEKFYSVHPPLFAIISYAALSLGELQGVPHGQFYPPWYVLAIVIPLPIVGFWAFNEVLKSAAWSAVLCGYWIIGTPLLTALLDAQNGGINSLNHILANIGLMLVAGDLLGRRRMWPAAIGLTVIIWSRPHLLFFGVAAIWIARTVSHRRTGMTWVIGAMLISVGTLLLLNYAKFDNPFESGYRYIYDYRPNSFLGSRFYAHGLFSPHFFPENFWTMNLVVPQFRLSPSFLTAERSEWGAAIWFTTPILLVALFDASRWWRDKAARPLILASFAVIATFLMYHYRGASTRGCHFYSLDFLAVWLLLIAPWTFNGHRRWITLICLAWSAVYFNLIS